MAIASYTRLIMDQLADTGVTVVYANRDTADVMRSRIVNAARRLNLKVATHFDPRLGIVLGEVVEGQARPAGTASEALAREGYWTLERDGVVKVYWLVNDDPENWQVQAVGEWKDGWKAWAELKQFRWPRSAAALTEWRRQEAGGV